MVFVITPRDVVLLVGLTFLVVGALSILWRKGK